MKVPDQLKIKCSDEKAMRDSSVTVSGYAMLKLIAYRLKDVHPLFPEKSRMARQFVDRISPEKWESLLAKK